MPPYFVVSLTPSPTSASSRDHDALVVYSGYPLNPERRRGQIRRRGSARGRAATNAFPSPVNERPASHNRVIQVLTARRVGTSHGTSLTALLFSLRVPEKAKGEGAVGMDPHPAQVAKV